VAAAAAVVVAAGAAGDADLMLQGANRYSLQIAEQNSMNRMIASGMALLSLGVFSLFAGCAKQQQTRFDSPEQATTELISALRANDQKKLGRILGPDAGDLISSGDSVADRQGVETFLEQYDTRHSFVSEQAGTQTLVVGSEEWPMPIPLTNDGGGGWYFDTLSGVDELINRRVGKNELATMQVCLAIVDAQREYAFEDRDGNGLHDYAQSFRSDAGKKNGLFWKTEEGERPSPLGPLVIQATEEGYSPTRGVFGKPPAYHGYRFRVLNSQGANAPGGAEDYIVNGKMLGGFAAVAYPAEYGASGVMTFIVSHEGVVYQRDLGESTEKVAKKMTAFDPGVGWTKVEVPADQP